MLVARMAAVEGWMQEVKQQWRLPAASQQQRGGMGCVADVDGAVLLAVAGLNATLASVDADPKPHRGQTTTTTAAPEGGLQRGGRRGGDNGRSWNRRSSLVLMTPTMPCTYAFRRFASDQQARRALHV